MTQQPESEAQPITETERRARLVYWVRDRMRKVGIKSVRGLAKATGIHPSNAARWLGDKNPSGDVPLIWIGELCRVLRVDPAWFTVLPPIPEDPLAPYTLPEDDPFLVVLASARLARRDQGAEEADDPPAVVQPPARPRKRATQAQR